MYESPIEIIYDGLREQREENIYKLVLSCGVEIDKKELLKALAYDRRQYEKGHFDGYADGYKDREEKIVKCKDCKHWNPPDWIDALAVPETGICAKTNRDTWDYDYCSKAERKAGQ